MLTCVKICYVLFAAVEVAVRSLEDNPTFNAGHGSVWNEAGLIEMDAIIVDGCKYCCGCREVCFMTRKTTN